MLIIFGPAVAIMSRLRFALKLGVMGLLFLAPLSGLVYYVYGKLQADIDVADTERGGVREILPGRLLAQAVQAHRGASQIALSGDLAAKEKLPGLASAIDAKLAALEAKTAGTSFGTAEAVTNIKTRWLKLKEKNAQLSPEDSLQEHNRLVGDILAYVEETADKSGLTLDPDMDTFYLMDAAIFRATHSADYAGRLRARGSGILQRRVKTPQEDIRLNVLGEMIKRTSKRFKPTLARLSAPIARSPQPWTPRESKHTPPGMSI